MKKDQNMLEEINQKEQWKKPALTKMDVTSVTKSRRGHMTADHHMPPACGPS